MTYQTIPVLRSVSHNQQIRRKKKRWVVREESDERGKDAYRLNRKGSVSLISVYRVGQESGSGHKKNEILAKSQSNRSVCTSLYRDDVTLVLAIRITLNDRLLKKYNVLTMFGKISGTRKRGRRMERKEHLLCWNRRNKPSRGYNCPFAIS